MGVENEALARAVKTLLESDLPSALDTVETRWAATQAITLPDPVNVFIGHKPTVLELPSTSFPFVAVIVPNREPDKGGEWGFQECAYNILIDYFVIAADEATVNLIVIRYAEAIVDVLQTQSIIGGRSQQNYEPLLTLSEAATRHLIGGTTGDAFKDEDVDYIQMGRITVKVE